MTDRDSTRLKLVKFYEDHNPQKLAGVEETLDKYEGRYEELFSLLENKYRKWPTPQGTGPTCFLDIDIDGARCGRLVIQLFADKVPKAAENFRRLCAGNAGNSDRCWGKKRHYKGSPFHRVIPGFVAQSGDFFRGDGTGGESAYAGTADADANGKFADESCMMAHDRRGLLSMANSGKDTNGSQFFITLSEVKHLNGKHIVFGIVTSGFEVLDQIEQQPTSCDRPIVPIIIADCGEISKCDPAMKTRESTSDILSELADLRKKLRAETGLAVIAESWARAAAATREACAVVSEAREKSLQLTNAHVLPPSADIAPTKCTNDANLIGQVGSAVHEGHSSEVHANRARVAFDALDDTGLGLLTMDKFEALLENLGEGFYGDELNTQFKLVDPENSGKLTRNAFIDYYTKLATGELDDDDSDEDDQDDIEEERENARAAFDAIDDAKSGYINHADFQKLIESLGTTYCEEVLCRTKRRLCASDGRIKRAHFVEWYAGWVTGDDDDDDELEDDNGAEGSDEAAIAATWQQLSSKKEGQWKCGTCSVYNEATARKCVACETPNPAAADSPADAAASNTVAETMGSIGAGGFTFNVGSSGIDSQTLFPGMSKHSSATAGPATETHDLRGAFTFAPAARETDTKIGFTFGAPSTVSAGATQTPKSTLGAPSFSFGVLPGSAVSTNTLGSRHEGKSPPGFVFSFGKPSDPQTSKPFGFGSIMEVARHSADSNITATATSDGMQSIEDHKRAPTVSESVTPSVDTHIVCRAGAAFDEVDVEKAGVLSMDDFDAILESLGEGFYGEEIQKNREFVDPRRTGTFTRDAFTNFYVRLVKGELRNSTDQEDDKALEADLEEERENARAAFDAIDTAQRGLINNMEFRKLIESLGTTYCEEEHSQTLMRLETKDKEIRRSDFVEWYANWVTGDDEYDEGEEDDDDEA